MVATLQASRSTRPTDIAVFVRSTRRAWPQTELIKSALANGDLAIAIRVAAMFFETYLATLVEGLWIDQFRRIRRTDRALSCQPAPSTISS